MYVRRKRNFACALKSMLQATNYILFMLRQQRAYNACMHAYFRRQLTCCINDYCI